jgi:hypothetical protein
MAVREGRWDCTYCVNIGILGRYTTCTGCARSRPERVKFYLPEDEAEVVDEKLLNLANGEADWVCRYCDSSNRAQYSSCQHCASPREAENPSQAVVEYDLAQTPRQGDNAEPAPASVVEPAKEGRSYWRYALGCLGIIIAGFALLCGFTIYAGFYTDDVQLTVEEVSWSRQIPIEEYRTVVEEDWTLPAGGRMTTQEERIHHHDEVLDHYENKTREVCEQVKTGTRTYTCGSTNKGNGFFEDKKCTEAVYERQCHNESYRDPVYRKEPVYQTWYTYEIEKWILDRTETASGQDHDAHWPEFNLVENEREGQRVESYEVHFVDAEGENYIQALPYEEWLKFKEDTQYSGKVDFFGDVVEIEGRKIETGLAEQAKN